MVSIITKRDCAACRECCQFESADLLITPHVSEAVKREALAIRPGQRFFETGDRRLFAMEEDPEDNICYCPMLDHKCGCMLGDRKPFECRIFPLRVMNFEGRLVIAVSSACPLMSAVPLGELTEEAKRSAPAIFAEADKDPGIVRPFEPGHVILIVQNG